jgi:hypothetical protein
MGFEPPVGEKMNDFQVGTVSRAYQAIDSYTVARLRRWLRTKFKQRRKRGGGYPPSILYDRMRPHAPDLAGTKPHVGEGVMSCPRAGCGRSARLVR